MGFCYDRETGALVCDFCGKAGARKVPCPFGYCPPVAACPECRKTKADKLSKDAHIAYGCQAGHEKYIAHEEERARLQAAGKPVRCSAGDAGPDRVHVLFRYADGTTEGWYMKPAVYHAFGLLENATPDDYRPHGKLEPAPATFDHGATSKRRPMVEATAAAPLIKTRASFAPPAGHIAPRAQVEPSEILGELIESTRPKIEQLDLFA